MDRLRVVGGNHESPCSVWSGLYPRRLWFQGQKQRNGLSVLTLLSLWIWVRKSMVISKETKTMKRDPGRHRQETQREPGRQGGLPCLWKITPILNVKELSHIFFSKSFELMSFFFFFLMAAPMARGNSQARDWICDLHCSCNNARSFNPLCWARNRTCTSAVTWAPAVEFSTYCAIAGTPGLISFYSSLLTSIFFIIILYLTIVDLRYYISFRCWA